MYKLLFCYAFASTTSYCLTESSTESEQDCYNYVSKCPPASDSLTRRSTKNGHANCTTQQLPLSQSYSSSYNTDEVLSIPNAKNDAFAELLQDNADISEPKQYHTIFYQNRYNQQHANRNKNYAMFCDKMNKTNWFIFFEINIIKDSK